MSGLRAVAFLRGVNLGGRRVTNAELRAAAGGGGVENVDTFLASGNVIFDHPGTASPSQLERRLEARFEEALGFETATFVRPMERLRELAGLELLDRGADDGFQAHVIFLESATDDAAEEALAALEGDDDELHPLGREVVWLRRGGMARAPITPRDLEKALGGRGHTQRTANTVRRLVAKFGEPGR